MSLLRMTTSLVLAGCLLLCNVAWALEIVREPSSRLRQFRKNANELFSLIPPSQGAQVAAHDPIPDFGDDKKAEALYLMLRAGAGVGHVDKIMEKFCTGNDDQTQCGINKARYISMMETDFEEIEEKFLQLVLIRRQVPPVLQGAARKKIEKEFTEDRAATAQFMWDQLDENKDGTVNRDEVFSTCQNLAKAGGAGTHEEKRIQYARELFLFSCSECSKDKKTREEVYHSVSGLER